MDVPTLSTFLRPILNVTTVWNTGGTGDSDQHKEMNTLLKYHSLLSVFNFQAHSQEFIACFSDFERFSAHSVLDYFSLIKRIRRSHQTTIHVQAFKS